MDQIRKMALYVGLIYGLMMLIGGCSYSSLSEEAPRSPLEKGREYEQNHQYADAEQEYQQIDDIVVQTMTLNQLYAAWENVNANIARTQKAVNLQPRSATARLNLAQEYYNKGLLCSRYTQEAHGNYPRDFIFGEQEYFYSESLNQAKKALHLQRDLPKAYLLIGEIYLANFRYNEALKELKQLIVTHPDYAKGYYAIGKVYLDIKQYDKVERYFIRTIKLDPDFIDAYYLLGKFYLERHWYDYAVETFLEILRRKPSDVPTLDLLIEASHKLGNYYVYEGQYDQGIRIFEEILLVRSSYPVHQSLLRAKKVNADMLLQREKVASQSAMMADKDVAQKPASAPLPESEGVPETLPGIAPSKIEPVLPSEQSEEVTPAF